MNAPRNPGRKERRQELWGNVGWRLRGGIDRRAEESRLVRSCLKEYWWSERQVVGRLEDPQGGVITHR